MPMKTLDVTLLLQTWFADEELIITYKNVNNDSVSPSSRVLREEDVRGVESDLVDSFEEGEIRDDSVLYNDGCIKDCMEKNLEDDAGEILGVHSQGDCGNVTTFEVM
ncbi:hypothetical protein Tco_0153692 [Tanacetum coccineum]